MKKGTLSYYCRVKKCDKNYAKLQDGEGETCYIDKKDCIPGCSGNGLVWKSAWMTANRSTLAIYKGASVIVMHNQVDFDAQTQVVYTMPHPDQLAHQLVTFSVEARVINDGGCKDGKAGCIGLIHAADYNKGKLYAKTLFSNRDWKRISVTKRLPEKENFAGLTIMMRAIQNPGIHSSIVEFRNPRLEIGMLSITEY